MIKQTFLNLSLEKKETLIKAARKEFARYPLHQSSINRIIKEVGLARGTYYNYFDNIEDLYYYVIEEFKNKIDNNIENTLFKNHGDICLTFVDVFNFMIDLGIEDQGILKNMFLNMDSKLKNYFFPLIHKNSIKEKYTLLKKNIKTDSMKIKSEEQLSTLLELLSDSILQGMMRYFMGNKTADEVKVIFKNKVEIIKYGVYKEEENV